MENRTGEYSVAMRDIIEEAVNVLNKGGVLIYPTETCYGIGCDATDVKAVEKIYSFKKRDRNKRLTCIVDSLETAENYCKLTDLERYVCEKFMPGPLTIVSEKKDTLPDIVNKDFAFRISSEKICRQLSKKLGKPIVATSANISGKKSAYSIDQISEELEEKVDFVIDSGKLEMKKPSTIISLQTGTLEVFRQGPINEDSISREVEGFKDG